MFKGVVSTDEQVGVDAVAVADSSGVTEWYSCKIDVTVRISSYNVEEVSPAASLVTWSTKFGAAWSLVAGEQFNEESGNFEEAVKERSSNYTSPMSSEESLKGKVPRSVDAPIVVSGSSRNAEVD